jgi:hypothetical protein
LFITEFSKKYIEIETSGVKDKGTVLKQNLVILVPLFAVISGYSWYQYLTDEGLPHILTLPLFVIVFSLTRLRIAVFESSYIRTVRYFTAGAGALIFIHVNEFILESQKVFPALDRYKGDLEFIWYVIGVIFYYVGLRSYFKQLNKLRVDKAEEDATTTIE